MSVYFVQRADGGPIKIGCSAFLDARLTQLAINTKAKLVLLASAPGSFREEGRLHRQFAALRVEGEWFEDCAILRAAIAHVARTGALPPPIEQDREIVMAGRYLSGETLQSIADDFDMTRERVRQILRASNVPSLGHRQSTRRKAAPITDAEREVAEVYATGETPPAELQERYGIDASRLTMILKRTGTKCFGVAYWRTRDDDAERTAKIVELYQSGAKCQDIAAEVGLPATEHIYRYLQKAGVKASRKPHGNLDPADVIRRYTSGSTIKAIAEALSSAPATVHRVLEKGGALRSRAENEAIRVAAVRAANIRRHAAASAAAA